MIHNIISVTFYQTVTFKETSINGRKAFNTIDNVLLPGVRLSREGESVVIEHDDFESSYCVGMANVRHYRFEKVESKEDEKAKALERNKNIGTSAASDTDSQCSNSNNLVNSSQYKNTDTQAFRESEPVANEAETLSKALDDAFDTLNDPEKREKLKVVKKKAKKKAKKKTKKKVSKKCTPKKKKNS